MLDVLVKNLVLVKQDFAKNYTGSAHIQEVIPVSTSIQFPVNSNHLEMLHDFAQKNPIYFNSYEEKIAGTTCVVYEGDINEYWLNSIKHGSSCQPFYPTWIMSAYVMALVAKKFGYTELVDVGSGDGRIAFCGKILGLISHSIEIDDVLVELQERISKSTNQNFNPKCNDALEFDYSQLGLTHPVFFIGGLSQMGGDILATNIINKIKDISNISHNAGIVFAGTNSKKQLSINISNGGWGSIIKKHNLEIIDTVSLPTIWTFDQKIETPYIYTKFN
ncbi:MAG: hypothetical protein QQN62_03020 [Nitrosopumilus sp.]|nr:hypothetical protein [Nitrososphaerota archaeon]